MLAGLSTAARARIFPFALFMALLGVRGALAGVPGFDARWVYGLSLASVAGLLVWFRHEYGELVRQNFPDARQTLEAIGVGLVVFVLWINLDWPWMQLATPTAAFVPVNDAGLIDWPLVVVRWCGAALLVPVMEELFWRSFLMRWIDKPQFQTVDPHGVTLRAAILSTGVFVLAHTLWLAAAIAGLAYAWLYIRSGKLWTAVIAHAVTNGVLGIWVVWTKQWQFW
jgi:CAAX prenyl protease-like protein